MFFSVMIETNDGIRKNWHRRNYLALQGQAYNQSNSGNKAMRKKILETMEKYYFADQGLLFFLHGYKDTYINGILENIVYLELLRRGFEVFIGKLGDTEIDFIAKKGGEVLYIQVSYLLSTEETKIREYRPLQAVNDNFPKLILTMDELPESNERGIVRKNIREWLLEKQ